MRIMRNLVILLMVLPTLFFAVERACAQETEERNKQATDNYYPGLRSVPQLDKAEQLVADDKQLEAIKLYENYLQKNHSPAKAWHRLAQLYSWNEMPDQVIRVYEKMLHYYPDDKKALEILAQNYVWTDRQKKAISIYQKLSALEPRNIDYHKKLAQLFSWNEMPDQAVHEYENIVQLDTTDVKVMRALAQQYFWSNRNKKGIALLEKVIRLIPDSLSVRRQLAQQYVWQGMPEKAAKQYEKILSQNPHDIDLMKKLAQIYSALNNYNKAIVLYKGLLQKEPNNSQLELLLAKNYLWSGKTNEAKIEFGKYIAKNPSDKEAHLLLGEIQRWTGEWDEAKLNLQKLLILSPTNKKAGELLTDIRKEYGPLIESKYSRIKDSNHLTREQIPLAYYYFINRHWLIQSGISRLKVLDGRINSSLVGLSGSFAAQYNITQNNGIRIEFSPHAYRSGWTAWGGKVQFIKNFFGHIYSNFGYYRKETQEGVQALFDKIMINGFAGNIYWQIIPRWYISTQVDYGKYSDANAKTTAVFSTQFSFFLKPKISLFGIYSYEDFKKLYQTSLPYWTPNKLRTISSGLKFEHSIKTLSTGIGVYLTRQQNVISQNIFTELGFSLTDFDKLFIRYEKTGSTVYNSTSLQAYYQHRF
ncbi:MAG: tetratricopeptide repeat protein [Calditrichaeota bacterium]|nr:tetratricopeptide repeat protein [Calditrichota bacterium]